MTRWPSQLLLLLSVAAALQLLVHQLPATVTGLCVGAGPPSNDTVELYPATVPPNRTPLVIGYLTAIKGELKDKQGLAISGALSMALDEINRDRYLLPNVTLQMRWNDTRGDTVLATRAMTDMICDGVVSFFGPEGPCYVEAIVSQSRNIPMISYKCSDYKASSIPTFARTEPPDTQVTKSVISLLMYYGWRKFSIVYEEPWTTVANSMKEQALSRNMTLNHLVPIVDNHKCCESMLSCCRIGFWFSLIQNTLNRTRIYVFLGTSTALVNMMSSMDDHSLFDKGEYMVIFVDMMTYSESTATQYLWKTEQVSSMTSCNQDLLRFRKRAQSLLVVVSTAPSENYTNFMNNVRAHNNQAPFYFTTPKLFWQYDKFISISAAYLYDSIKLYAWALDKLLRAQPGPLTGDIIRNVSLDGQRIIETIIANRTYKSVTGATIKIDKNGDSEGNFSVLALTAHSYTFPDKNITCDSYMFPVAYFTQGDDFPEYKIIDPQIKINWPGTEKPADQPFCGFHDELCPKDDSQVTSLIIACTLGLGLFCVTVIALSMYRKWKIELEIEGLLWRIEPDEIKGFNFNMNCDIVASPSKLSLVSAQSFGSRCSNQVFTTTGRYKGMVVRMKELKYARKKDISRDIMKEMRLLRDLRHDNINSFIGAVVEPMRTLLVTDYCAKGSLYDIVENEDIKLDEMFIASLVHDLIKGMMYIHASALDFHGNLKSSNCVVTSRWMLQVSDFGLHDLRHCAESESIGEHQYYRNQFWKAPELLREPRTMGSKKADVYAFAIILFEMIGRKGPFGQIQLEPKDIVERVKRRPDADANEEPFRPEISYILDSSICADYIVSCIKESWDENPEVRPEFTLIRQRLKKMRGGKSRNIMDQIMELMEKYANNLEDVVNERTRQLCDEKRKTEDLLHRMLPESVADSLTRGLGVEPVSYNSVTIYFSDIVGFTALSAVSTPLQVVNFLNDLYTLFDRVIKGYDVYKVETIGDAYMVVSGLPIKNDERHVGEIASMSLDLLYAIRHHRIAHRPQEVLKLRVGMHTGPVVAGVVGLTMPRYCLFGDTVNTASRMESNGEALRIHISVQCKEALDRLGGYVTEDRGRIQMKGKGEVQTYWLVGATEEAVQRREVNLGDLPPLFSRPRYSPGRLMAADSRQGSTMGLQYFGSRRQSSSVIQRAEAVSMYSLQGALISSTSFAGPIQQPAQPHPPPPNRLDSPHSSSQSINRTPILLACDSTAGVAHAVRRILDGDGDDEGNQPEDVDNATGSRQSFADCQVVDDDDSDSARPSDQLLLTNRRQPIYQCIPPQSHSELIRRPLLIRPSQSMDHFPAQSAASSSAAAANGLNHRGQQPAVSRLRKRVDSAISLVSTARQGGGGSTSRPARALQFAARNRSSRSLDAGCGGTGAPEATVALIDAADRLRPPVNGADDGRLPENGSAAAAGAAPAPTTTDLGTLYKPYLNNNCNGGNGAPNATPSTGPAHAVNSDADNDNPNCPLLLHHAPAQSNGPSATFATPSAPSATETWTSSASNALSYASRTVNISASEAPAKRWHSLDPMGDGYAAAAVGGGGDHYNSADDAPLEGGKKQLASGANGQRGGSLRTWLLGLFGVGGGVGGGRSTTGGGGGGGGGGGRGGAIIVPTGRLRGVATVAFGERSSQSGTPDTESIV